MWLRMHKRSARVSYSHRKRTKVTVVEEINPVTTKKNELRLLAAMDSCFGLVKPRQHGIFFGSVRRGRWFPVCPGTEDGQNT